MALERNRESLQKGLDVHIQHATRMCFPKRLLVPGKAHPSPVRIPVVLAVDCIGR